jgi:hypothetical protein
MLLWRLVHGWQFFPESAAAPEIAGRCKEPAHCLREGLPVDRCVTLKCEIGVKMADSPCIRTGAKQRVVRGLGACETVE